MCRDALLRRPHPSQPALCLRRLARKRTHSPLGPWLLVGPGQGALQKIETGREGGGFTPWFLPCGIAGGYPSTWNPLREIHPLFPAPDSCRPTAPRSHQRPWGDVSSLLLPPHSIHT